MDNNNISVEGLKQAMIGMFGVMPLGIEYSVEPLQEGTVGDVKLITGVFETEGNEKKTFQIVLKIQKRWERPNDSGSWRREYDLYSFGFNDLFYEALSIPKCYYKEIEDGRWQIWMEYVKGVSGAELSLCMYEKAAEELGRFQGRLYIDKPELLSKLTNLGNKDAMKDYYNLYRSKINQSEYLRSIDCIIPEHLKSMLIEIDEQADEIFSRVEQLPIVFCHRDFWNTNIIFSNDRVVLIDWDTAGYGYLAEDIVSLIADETDVNLMLDCFYLCPKAYIRGFMEFVDLSDIPDIYVIERVILHYGYRLVEWVKHAKSEDSKKNCIDTLQKIFKMREQNYAKPNT